MKKLKFITIALISLTLLALELAWTRIFSAEFFYTFAFLIISLSIMGTSMGGLALRLSKRLNNPKLLGVYLSLAGLLAFLAPILVFKLQLDFTQLFISFSAVLKLIVSIFLLSSCFFFGGLSLALLFRANHKEMPKLYMVDLIAAGISVLFGVVIMNYVGTQYSVFLIAIPIILAGLINSSKYLKVVPIVFLSFLFFMIGGADSLLETKTKERAPVIYKHWDAMAKIKLYSYGKWTRGMNIDNVANSPVFNFDGNYDTIAKMNPTPWMIDVKNLIKKFDHCKFLSLGAGGGGDVLQALSYGASEVHAVEVNPHINKMLVEGDKSGYFFPDSIPESNREIITCKEYSGDLYNDERVKVISEDARTYVRRFHNKFDIIYSLSSNTWAALGSGSFAFAENYIFTTEAFIDYWNSLSENGFLSMEHQMYMTRIVSSVMDALNQLGIKEPKKHFAVYSIPKARRKILLMSKQPLDSTTIANAYGQEAPNSFNKKVLLYPVYNKSKPTQISQVVENGWQKYTDKAKTQISPTTDNRPFIAQLGKWDNFSIKGLKRTSKYSVFSGFPVTKTIIIIILIILFVLFIPLTIIPFFKSGKKLKFSSWMFFFTIGLAFMIMEIVLMQKYSLFIGASFYSIVTVLLTLLIASGVGSKFSEKFTNIKIFGAIALWVLLDVFVFNYVLDSLTSLPIFFRSLIISALIFPLGFFMGMPFPKATLKVGELVDWGFAINGVASTLGATAIMLIVFAFGFNIALFIGAILYIGAFLLIEKGKW